MKSQPASIQNRPQKFRGKYRVKSMRLQNYDYSSDGAYFITLCAQNREYFFGKIQNAKMQLSEIGTTAEKFWLEIEKLHDFAIVDEFTVMPNHIHGIIFIQNNYGAAETNRAVETRRDSNVETRRDVVETRRDVVETRQWRVSTNNEREPTDNNDKSNANRQFQQLPKKSISSIVNHFKGATKKWANKNDCKYFAWQKNFYDHIIRDDAELNRIRDYIFLNPQNWENDQNNLENLYI